MADNQEENKNSEENKSCFSNLHQHRFFHWLIAAVILLAVFAIGFKLGGLRLEFSKYGSRNYRMPPYPYMNMRQRGNFGPKMMPWGRGPIKNSSSTRQSTAE